MKNLIGKRLLLLTFVLLASCGKTTITENEDKGIKEILSFYGGLCKYSRGFYKSSSNTKQTYFELELSKSGEIENTIHLVEFSASNIAYLFYKNLNNEERKKYNEIKVSLLLSNGRKIEESYHVDLLEHVSEKIEVVYTIVDLIKEKNFNQFSEMINDSSFFVFNKADLLASLEAMEPQLGQITDGFSPMGFVIKEAQDGTRVFRIIGAVIREKTSNQLTIDIDFNRDNNSVYMIQYKHLLDT